jgi:pyruvyl transferase EpsI
MVNKCNILIRRIERLLKILRYAIQVRKCRYVLVDTPTHGNLGDHAIAMAEKQYLEKQFENIKYIELNADEINYHEKYYAYFTPQNCDIIVHGGGFLGEIWPYEEYRFRRIVKAFNHNRIIVFPQTVTFDLTTESVGKLFNESKKIYSEHPNMVIFVREEKSYDFMKRNMPDVLTELVPDIVTNLELPLEIMQRKDILLCMRKDREKALSEEMYSSILCELKSIYPKYELHFTDTVIDRSVMPKDRETEVKAKLNQFAQHKFVVTDRLHGMIFAAITNTPCIALGNSNGKVKGVYEAWLKNNQYIRYVADANQFGDVLREMDLDVEYMYNRDSMTKSLEPIEKCLRVGDYMDGVKDKKFIQKYWI